MLLVGALDGAAGEFAQRLQHLRPEWALVEKPTELLQKPEAMRLPALPGCTPMAGWRRRAGW